MTDSKDTRQPEPGQPDTEKQRLAAENKRLSAENAALKQQQCQRKAAELLDQLRETGQVTPAMEQAGLPEALAAAQEHGVQVQLPGGTSVPLAKVLADVLSAIPAVCASLTQAAAAGASTNAPEPAALTDDEKIIAVKLGLTEEEYAEIKSEV
jgi:phage I-like protein